jgi:hypothetical protein
VAAERLGETDPLSYIRDELSRYGGVPPHGSRPHQLLADATAADAVARKLVSW